MGRRSRLLSGNCVGKDNRTASCCNSCSSVRREKSWPFLRACCWCRFGQPWPWTIRLRCKKPIVLPRPALSRAPIGTWAIGCGTTGPLTGRNVMIGNVGSVNNATYTWKFAKINWNICDLKRRRFRVGAASEIGERGNRNARYRAVFGLLLVIQGYWNDHCRL